MDGTVYDKYDQVKTAPRKRRRPADAPEQGVEPPAGGGPALKKRAHAREQARRGCAEQSTTIMCKSCHETKPEEEFYHGEKDRRLRKSCAGCRAHTADKRRAALPKPALSASQAPRAESRAANAGAAVVGVAVPPAPLVRRKTDGVRKQTRASAKAKQALCMDAVREAGPPGASRSAAAAADAAPAAAKCGALDAASAATAGPSAKATAAPAVAESPAVDTAAPAAANCAALSAVAPVGAAGNAPDAAAQQVGDCAAAGDALNSSIDAAAASTSTGGELCGRNASAAQTSHDSDGAGCLASAAVARVRPGKTAGHAVPAKKGKLDLKTACAHGWDATTFTKTERLVIANVVRITSSNAADPAYTQEERDNIEKYFGLKHDIEGALATKGFRIAGVTKSCHQCQYQHVFRQCQCDNRDCECKQGSKGARCSQSVCEYCIERHYAAVGLTYEEACRICPRCRGVCNCRKHLREVTSGMQKPAFSATDEQQRFKTNLALVLPAVCNVVASWEHEARIDKAILMKIPKEQLNTGERMTCSRCHSCIADLHRTCTSCHLDLCTQCCHELRSANTRARQLLADAAAAAPQHAASEPAPAHSRFATAAAAAAAAAVHGSVPSLHSVASCGAINGPASSWGGSRRTGPPTERPFAISAPDSPDEVDLSANASRGQRVSCAGADTAAASTASAPPPAYEQECPAAGAAQASRCPPQSVQNVSDQQLCCPNETCDFRRPLVLRRLQDKRMLADMLLVARKAAVIEAWADDDAAHAFCGGALRPGTLPTPPRELHFKADLPPRLQQAWVPPAAVGSAPQCAALDGAASVGRGVEPPAELRAGQLAGDAPHPQETRPLPPGLRPDTPLPKTPAALSALLKELDARLNWAPTDEEVRELRARSPVPLPETPGVVSDAEWRERLRLVAWKVPADEQHLLCLDAQDIADADAPGRSTLDSERAAAFKTELFRRWQLGQPILVSNVSGKIPWDPICMTRATKEMGNKSQKVEKLQGEEGRLHVQRCCDWEWVEPMTQAAFFAAYAKGGVDIKGSGRAAKRRADSKSASRGEEAETTMLKLKDFPPKDDFKTRLLRHYQDFLELLPAPEMTRMDVAPHNLATMVDPAANPCDLGPKCYVAFGRPEQRGVGDSVTKTHLDMSDAVNVMLHQQGLNTGGGESVQRRWDAVWQAPHYQGAGAVWDIWQRKDLDAVRQFMREASHLFVDAKGQPVQLAAWEDPVYSEQFMLTDDLRRLLWHRHGVQGWHFEQRLGEAVFIPAGCPHQVRNLDSCIKVAVDFVSPHNLGLCLHMARELRTWRNPEEELRYGGDAIMVNEDRLAAQSILVHAVHAMLPAVRPLLGA